MNTKIIDLNKSVFELCKEHPEVTTILADLGFKDITKPGMLATAGRFMTIPKGATMKKINLNEIKQTFINAGYEIRD